MKINTLIVDDERGIRESLKEYIEMKYENLNTDISENADEALKKIENKSYHLILLDIVMPGMDAFDFLKRVKEINPLIQVLMITGNSTMEKVLSALENGADDYLTKPFDFDDLENIIKCNIEKIVRWREVFKNSL